MFKRDGVEPLDLLSDILELATMSVSASASFYGLRPAGSYHQSDPFPGSMRREL